MALIPAPPMPTMWNLTPLRQLHLYAGDVAEADVLRINRHSVDRRRRGDEKVQDLRPAPSAAGIREHRRELPGHVRIDRERIEPALYLAESTQPLRPRDGVVRGEDSDVELGESHDGDRGILRNLPQASPLSPDEHGGIEHSVHNSSIL